MVRLIAFITTVVLASVGVVADTLLDCGASRYHPSQYTCFDGNFLCPIINDDIYIRCGDACYSTSMYSCSDTTLEPINKYGPETLEDCGYSRFYPSQAICLPRWGLPLPQDQWKGNLALWAGVLQPVSVQLHGRAVGPRWAVLDELLQFPRTKHPGSG
ncbi:carbohydrate binding-domain-containing protein [Mycena sanguinolenta]|nr:carbohydrate binding-domain-containing protein [Mycena sanguinolenta]